MLALTSRLAACTLAAALAVLTSVSLTASQQSEAELLEAALAAPAQNLGASYLMADHQLALLGIVAKRDAPNLNLFLGGVKVTEENLTTFENQFQSRRKAYESAIRRRGFPKVAGEYHLETIQPCEEESFSANGTLTQEEFRLELRLESLPAGETGISGVALEGTVVFGTGDIASGSYVFGSVTEQGIDLRPFSAPGCGLRLTRK